MDPLELLNSSQQSDELRRTISTAAFLWALATVVALLMSSLGWITSYDNALPFVVLSAWLGAEIVACLPGRIPIAVCEKCERVQVLPRGPLRKFWPWKRCTVCGGQLNYACPHKHMLSLFLNEEIQSSTKEIWCSRCGQPSRALSGKEFIDGVRLLISQKPKEMDHMKLAPLIWTMIRGTDLGNELREHMSEIDQKYRPPGRPARPTRMISLEDNNPEPDPDDLFRGWAS
jgi:hypothetical protein